MIKKKRQTVELLEAELESLYMLLKIAPDRQRVERMIKERETILKRRQKQKESRESK